MDTTVIKLLDGTRAYIHAVIDNFSRRILAFRVAHCFEVANTVAILVDAASKAVSVREAPNTPMLVVDGGVENFNGGVDDLIDRGLLHRVLALTELRFSGLAHRGLLALDGAPVAVPQQAGQRRRVAAPSVVLRQ